MKNFKNKAFYIFFTIFVVYCILFIFSSSYEIEGTRYFSLFDDAMISMRYADNLSQGHGAVFNIAEDAVEGFTNPLWMAYMSLLHLTGVEKQHVSLLVQISGLLFLVLNLVYLKKICGFLFKDSNITAMAALMFTGFYLPLNFWSLMGMEVSVLAFITTFSAFGLLKAMEEDKLNLSLLILPSIGILIRLDMVLVFSVITLALLFKLNCKKKVLISSFLFFILPVFLQFLIRYDFYGELLPNTYYLKMTGFPVIARISKGLFAFLKFVLFFNPIIFIIPLVYTALKRDFRFYCLLAFLFVQAAYSIYTGGDAWEWWGGSNRFLSISMPLFFVVLAAGLTKVYSLVLEHKDLKINGFLSKKLSFVVTTILIILSINFIHGPYAIGELLLISRPFSTSDSIILTKMSGFSNKILKPDATAAVATAGVLPYYSNFKIIDLLGKNDKHIARMKADIPQGLKKYHGFNPGHNKWDYSYSIGELKPDAVLQLWKQPEDAKPYLDEFYSEVTIDDITIFLRKDSKEVNWQAVQKLSE